MSFFLYQKNCFIPCIFEVLLNVTIIDIENAINQRIIIYLSLISICFSLAFKPPSEPDRINYQSKTFDSWPDFYSNQTAFEQRLFLELQLQKDETIVLKSIHSSPFATHYRYVQTLHGKEIVQAGVTVHQYKNGSIMLQKYLYNTDEFQYNYTQLPYLLAQNGVLIGVDQITISKEEDKKHQLINEENKVLYEYDYYRYFQADTPVRGNVYMLNPVNSADTVYGGNFVDNNDSNNLALQAELTEKVLMGTFRNDTFFLENPFIKFEEISPPVVDSSHYSLTDSFLYNRSQIGFESFNAYYHVHTIQQYVFNLGFDSLVQPLIIDAYAMFGADNSRFDPNNFSLEFGTGGVDDAEDGEVITHEFTHSLSSMGSPSLMGDGIERISMEEGNCDYFAKSYSRSITPTANIHKVFSWDGHNPFFPNAPVTNLKGSYPSSLTLNINQDRSFWSSALICFWEKIGRGVSDTLILEHFFYQFSQATMPEMAENIIQLDSIIFNKAHFHHIIPCFKERNLTNRTVSTPRVAENISFGKILNSYDFAQGLSDLVIVVEGDFDLELISMDGKSILNKNAQNETQINPIDIPSGIYVILIRKGQQFTTHKIIKF